MATGMTRDDLPFIQHQLLYDRLTPDPAWRLTGFGHTLDRWALTFRHVESHRRLVVTSERDWELRHWTPEEVTKGVHLDYLGDAPKWTVLATELPADAADLPY